MMLLQKSIQGAVMILVTVVIRALFINKLPKKTFLALWAAAVFCLLFPFSIRSRFSVYSLIEKEGARITGAVQNSDWPGHQATGQGEEGAVAGQALALQGSLESHRGNLKGFREGEGEMAEAHNGLWAWQRFFQPSPWKGLWLAGTLLCAGYFGIAYWKCRRAFAVSLPVKNETADKWLEAHSLRRKISIRQSGIPAPLTYGIVSPVILMPKNTHWGCADAVGAQGMESREGSGAGGEGQQMMGWELSLCLEHEFVHIKRLDGATKLVLAAALCLHWFNPLVWVMYILANRDLELSCDERVVRTFGEKVKPAYARTLIHMEEKKSAFLPLCNNFSKNAIEERITAIMKIKKFTLLTAIAAVVLAVGIPLAFATQATEKGKPKTELVREILGGDYTWEECQLLAALWFEGYEDMAVAGFQEKVWAIRDTDKKYLELEERLADVAMQYRQEAGEPDFWEYYNNIYGPLAAEKWQQREFAGYASKELATKERPDLPRADLEYFFTLSILKPGELTVREYHDTYLAVKGDLQAFWEERTVEELSDGPAMEQAVSQEAKRIMGKRGSDKLAVSIDYFFNPVDIHNSLQEEAEKKPGAGSGGGENAYGEEREREERQYPYGTRADYDSLLTLRTQGYESLTLAVFNERLLAWCNQNHEAMERIGEDAFNGDYQVALTEEEQRFVSLTVQLSRFENERQVTSSRTGEPEKDPWWGGFNYIQAEDDMWCRLYFQFPYHISDKAQVTVGERDQCVGGMTGRILKFWEDTALEDRTRVSEEEIVRLFETWAEECSSGQVVISIHKDYIKYEAMDERDHARGQAYLGTVATEGTLRHYISAGEEEKHSKYFHLTVRNGTEKEISAFKYTMLAYDSEGNPMEVFWHFIDSSAAASYECTVEEQCRILPGEAYDEEGGWSIYDRDSSWGVIDLGPYGEEYRVAYVLSCITQIDFVDGEQWHNPDYESWRAECHGKKVPYAVLGEFSKWEYEIFGSGPENGSV